MIDEDSLLDFARACASAYCARHGAWRQYDDAVGNVCLYLLVHRDKWQTVTRGELKRRAVLNLIRVYQTQKGLRRAKTARQADAPIEEHYEERDDIADYDNREEARYKICRAALNAGVSDYLPLLLARGEGKTIDEITIEFNTSKATFNRVYNRFLNELIKLNDVQQGVSIVAPVDEGNEPLFKMDKNNG